MLKRLFWSEVIGSALLVLGGLSLVILMFGTGTPMARILPDEGWHRLITGFFFGSTGARSNAENSAASTCFPKSLGNNGDSYQKDHKRTFVWFRERLVDADTR